MTEELQQAQAEQEAAAALADIAATPEDPDRKWYVVHTYSGYENKVKANLERRIKSMSMQDFVYRVLVPTDKEVEFKDGHEIVFHYDPKGRYNEWAFGSRSVTPEEAKILNKLQEDRDNLIDAHRRGDMSDKDFEAAMEKESKKGEKHLRKRWKEINKGEK